MREGNMSRHRFAWSGRQRRRKSIRLPIGLPLYFKGVMIVVCSCCNKPQMYGKEEDSNIDLREQQIGEGWGSHGTGRSS